MVLIDTCGIIELCKPEPKLAKSTLSKIHQHAVILSISFAEIACKIKINKLVLQIKPLDLYLEYNNINNITIVDIGTLEWLDSIDLDWNDNKDPSDRLIVSYAIKNDIEIVTCDKKIKKYYKNIIW